MPPGRCKADVGDPVDAALVAGRARDLGGADLLVNPAGGWAELTRLVAEAAGERRGRRTPAGIVNLGPDRSCVIEAGADDPARIMAVVVPPGAPTAAVVRAVVDLLARGESGQVVEVGPAG